MLNIRCPKNHYKQATGIHFTYQQTTSEFHTF